MRHTTQPPPKPEKISPVEVYWHTVTYRTLVVLVLLVAVVVLLVWYLINPAFLTQNLERFAETFAGGPEAGVQPVGSQVRFVNLDGRVHVKKADSVDWVPADYRMVLDKGDLIRTGPDGVARLSFADGSTYTIKPDTLMTVEENSVYTNRTTRVGVRVTTGAVDLSTGTWEAPGSTAKVSFENAVASLKENSRAAVRTDPTRNQHEITVTAGAADLQRGGLNIPVSRWEKVSFATGGEITKTQVLAPPELVEPVNFQPIIVPDPRQTIVRFAWRTVPQATAYHLRVGTSSMFTQLVAERRTQGTSVTLSGLDAGDYFWTVAAIDAEGKQSEPSDTYKFTLVAQGKGDEMLLEVEGTQLHGSVVEVIGRTEPGAAVLINGQPVANVRSDGRFRHYTPPLPRGNQVIVVTGQNRRGATAIKRVPVVIP
ncbi:MAG: FecR domain-containing protein [Firmicutes bacterium]|nr:FecR domain-containing protein [Bacillota bacterium]